MSKRNSEIVNEAFDRVVRAGRVPYKANKQAMRALDIEDNGVKGDKELKKILISMGVFIKEMEGLTNVADAVVRRVSAGVR